MEKVRVLNKDTFNFKSGIKVCLDQVVLEK